MSYCSGLKLALYQWFIIYLKSCTILEHRQETPVSDEKNMLNVKMNFTSAQGPRSSV